MKAVILAAGIGSRLGNPYPKSLNKLPYGESIIERQVRILRELGIYEIIAVVGFKKELIMEHVSTIYYKYNPVYYLTNTSKSLLIGIEDIYDDLLWLNGDVVFEKAALRDLINAQEKNKILVNNEKCEDEEVKYSIDELGRIKEISKQVIDAKGEALGINMISKDYLETFKECLKKCNDNDYFEKGIEIAINRNMSFFPICIGEKRCIEVDFHEDWEKVCGIFNREGVL